MISLKFYFALQLMKSVPGILILLLLLTSCDQEVSITFTEVNKISEKNALVEINIPSAEGESPLSKSFNNTLENHIAGMLSFSEPDTPPLPLEEAIELFDKEYSEFKSEMTETALRWEALFDGEVIYQSSEVITVAINGYLNTGGAHGNMNISLYNFDGKSGELLNVDDLIDDIDALTEFVQPYFEKEIKQQGEAELEDYFFGEPFHLPANIGLNDEGVLFLYNTYEIAPYAMGITEFTISFDEIQKFLLLQ